MPKSKTETGFTYSLNQEKYLRVFLEDGDVPLDNNAAEHDNGMAMNYEDLKVTQDYFKNEEKRDPTEAELKVLDLSLIHI